MSPQARSIPLDVRVELASAALQFLADSLGVDLVHIKGPAADRDLRAGAPSGSDVDVIVRPTHVGRLVRALEDRGWERQTDFTSGSAFDHAANYFHPHWGLLDVHRSYPGFEVPDDDAFDVLWAGREQRTIGGRTCPVPDRTAQCLIHLLHAARSTGAAHHPDVGPSWRERTEEERERIAALARRLHARVGLAAALGDLDSVSGEPTAALWRSFAQEDGTRLGQWRARLSAARGPRAKASVVVRAFGVNRYYLEQRLGRPATRTDLAREFVRRLGRAAAEATRRGR